MFSSLHFSIVRGMYMISLTALNNVKFYLNEDNIEKMEAVPQSVITLSNGKKYLVAESNKEIVDKIIKFKSEIFREAIQEASSK